MNIIKQVNWSDILLSILVCVAIVSIGWFGYQGINYLIARKEYHSVETKFVSKGEGKSASERVGDSANSNYDVEVPNMKINFDSLQESNPDCIGWLYIPSVSISYPVVQSKNNKDYLDTTFEGTHNAAGAIFNDKRFPNAFKMKTILYGHNMRDGSMFAGLRNIEGAVDDHKDIWIYVPNGIVHHYEVSYTKRTKYSDVDIYGSSGPDDLLVLSTCIKNDDRYVVVARLEGSYIN